MRSLQEFCDHLKAIDFVPRTFIDVGACYGTPELFNSFPNAYQILFEPVPELEERLKLLTTKFRGEYHMIALGDKRGTMTLHVPTDGIEGATLVPSSNNTKIDVEVDTLDHVLRSKELERPILLKTDCQGYDLNVINGGQQLLPDIDVIVMEVNLYHPRNLKQFPDFAEIVCKMKEYGFAVYDIVSYQVRPRDNALGYVDIVFARDDGPLRAHHSWA
jgi:FkbM family methyltransferase